MKMNERKQNFLERKENSSSLYENMVSFISYQRNVNQNQN